MVEIALVYLGKHNVSFVLLPPPPEIVIVGIPHRMHKSPDGF